MRSLTMQLDGGTLIARVIQELGEVVLSEHSRERQRLIVLCPEWLLFDDGGLGHHCFSTAIGARGILSTSENLHEATWVFEAASQWLREGREVTVAAYDNSPELLLALVAVAGGRAAPESVELVRRVSPRFVWVPDAEIPVSLLAENLAAQRRENP